MSLWDEAEKISLLGIEVYRYGFFVALGLLAAAVVICFLSWAKRCPRGTSPLLLLLSLILGGLCSRLGFCLMNQELGFMMPLSSWLRLSAGGWSMMTLIPGVLLAAWITAKITGQRAGQTLDIAACALPAFIALERVGEGCIRDGGIPAFNYSRPLQSTFLNGTFLAFSDPYGEYCLATWRLAAIVAVVLLVVLLIDQTRSKRHGDTCLLFLMLFGASSVILESLRYDRFLSITFVGLEQVLAAVLMFSGILGAALRAEKRWQPLGRAAVISVFIAAGIAIGLEFALDRTTVSRILIYVVYVLVIFAPVVMGIRLRNQGTEK